MRYPLPSDTAAILKTSAAQNKNLGLALDRYLQINDADNEGTPWKNPEEAWKVNEESRQRRNAPISFGRPIPELLKSVNRRHDEMLKGLTADGYIVARLEAKVDYRLAVGFGAEHVLETNLCLHRIYGIPIIPGSAAKGLTRAAAFWAIALALGVPVVESEEAERRKNAKTPTPIQRLDRLLSAGKDEAQESLFGDLLSDPLCREVTELQSLDLPAWKSRAQAFYEIFGTTEQRGSAIFFDAFPMLAPVLKPAKLDILNPHFGKYYSSQSRERKIAPTDDDSPIPTLFLTVDQDSRFLFSVAGKSAEMVTKAQHWLFTGLTDLGIGGKTSAGYGFMEVQP